MKKILFSLIALVCSMSMNAQVMKIMKNGEEVAKYNGAEYSVVFEEEPAVKPYSVKFEHGDLGRGNSDFTGWESSTITASNDDVTIELTLSGDRRAPIWNDMGDIQYGMMDSKLTITVTPKAGVTVTGIEYKGDLNTATKTGTGPWEFTVEGDQASDGSTNLGPGFRSITVNYEK